MSYDGTTKVGDELAKLYGISSKSSVPISRLMTEAREALNIGNTKRLTSGQNLAIYEYHRAKINRDNNPVENIQQSDSSVKAVENIQHYNPDKPVRIAFYTHIDGIRKRQIVALYGHMFNALMFALRTSSKADVPKWLNSQSFVANKSTTLQVQQLIVAKVGGFI